LSLSIIEGLEKLQPFRASVMIVCQDVPLRLPRSFAMMCRKAYYASNGTTATASTSSKKSGFVNSATYSMVLLT
jgi:hypothetical protein